MNKPCKDCKTAEGVVHYGCGGARCLPCSDVFDKALYEKRLAKHRAEVARKAMHICGKEDDDRCERCCEHGDVDGVECLDCGADMTEYLAGMAEAYFEGDR